MLRADENTIHTDRALMCGFRVDEAKFGFLEARLTLLATSDGGRSKPIFSDYRPDWNVGNRLESGEVEINGARVSLGGATSIPPGGSGVVRLHPLWPEAWRNVRVGAEIDMHEGARIVGKATILRVALRVDGVDPGRGRPNKGASS
jgi:hypothetical protein